MVLLLLFTLFQAFLVSPVNRGKWPMIWGWTSTSGCSHRCLCLLAGGNDHFLFWYRGRTAGILDNMCCGRGTHPNCLPSE